MYTQSAQDGLENSLCYISSPVQANKGRSTVSSSLSKSLTVVVVHTVAWADPLEISDVVAQLFDALHLLVEEVALNEVSHLKKENR